MKEDIPKLSSDQHIGTGCGVFLERLVKLKLRMTVGYKEFCLLYVGGGHYRFSAPTRTPRFVTSPRPCPSLQQPERKQYELSIDERRCREKCCCGSQFHPRVKPGAGDKVIVNGVLAFSKIGRRILFLRRERVWLR